MVDSTELASRIARTAIETKSGRYDWASKVEVREYVILMVAGVRAGVDEEFDRLHARIAELELSWWQRLLRKLRA